MIGWVKRQKALITVSLGYPAGKPKISRVVIESIQPIGINEIFADIKLIYAAYLIFAVAVKSESRKIRPLANKKGKSR